MTERLQVIVAWFSTATSSLYFAWMLLVLNRHTRAFKSVTLAVAVLVLFVADWIRTAYLFPLSGIVEKLQ